MKAEQYFVFITGMFPTKALFLVSLENLELLETWGWHPGMMTQAEVEERWLQSESMHTQQLWQFPPEQVLSHWLCLGFFSSLLLPF